MTNRKVLFGALLAVSIMSQAASGQELDGTLKKVKESSTLTLGYLESAPPFSFPGPDRRPVGYSIDLCTQIASAIQKQLGVSLKLNWVPVTTANRLDMVASGK
ncbi:MAG: transporter substrate-binding domain-containing protein, partial [Candidatus Binatia bacterium]